MTDNLGAQCELFSREFGDDYLLRSLNVRVEAGLMRYTTSLALQRTGLGSNISEQFMSIFLREEMGAAIAQRKAILSIGMAEVEVDYNGLNTIHYDVPASLSRSNSVERELSRGGSVYVEHTINIEFALREMPTEIEFEQTIRDIFVLAEKVLQKFRGSRVSISKDMPIQGIKIELV